MEFTDEELETGEVPLIEAAVAEVGLSLLKSLRSVIFNVEDFFWTPPPWDDCFLSAEGSRPLEVDVAIWGKAAKSSIVDNIPTGDFKKFLSLYKRYYV